MTVNDLEDRLVPQVRFIFALVVASQVQSLESAVSEEKLRPRLMYAVPQTCRKLE